MKNLIILLALIVLPLSLTAQTIEYTEPGKDIQWGYATGSFDVNPFGDIYNYEMSKKLSFTDILLPGYIDTAKTTIRTSSGAGFAAGLSATFYGKVIPLRFCDSLSRMHFQGYDSAFIQVFYRKVTRTANVWGAGPWLPYDTTGGAKYTNNIAIGSSSVDSVMVGDDPNVPDWDDFTPYIQFKYVITSGVALKGDGSKRTMRKPTGNNQPFWRGEAIITYDRGQR